MNKQTQENNMLQVRCGQGIGNLDFMAAELSWTTMMRRKKIFGVPPFLQGAAKSCRGAPKNYPTFFWDKNILGAAKFFCEGGGAAHRFVSPLQLALTRALSETSASRSSTCRHMAM